MSDQFNISSIPGFSISQIEPSDLPTVLDCMNEIYRELPEKSWFSMDEREDLIRYMTVSGFGLKAEAVAADGRKELAAVFVARTSDLGDENLGSYLEPDDLQLSLVAHMEIAMVRSSYRGNGLQKKLMEAAEEQLDIWSKRAGADIIRRDKADPASVVFEAIDKAQKEQFDVILVDTAGRLQNKFNLMEELKKIKSVIDKKAPDALRECMLVLDANTGQNGLQQAKVFMEAVNLTSVALTKLDGSAKGAIVLAVAKEMKLPVKLIGVGEKMEDLKSFSSQDFIEAIFE